MTTLENLIRNASNESGMDFDLIASIIYMESGGEVWAFRYEPQFYTNRILPLSRSELSGHVPSSIPTLDTEKVSRACSYGLGQILGETARSILHFEGENLTELFDPELNINLCAQYLKILKTSYLWLKDENDIIKAVTKRYNGKGEAARAYQEKVYRVKDSQIWETILQIKV